MPRVTYRRLVLQVPYHSRPRCSAPERSARHHCCFRRWPSAGNWSRPVLRVAWVHELRIESLNDVTGLDVAHVESLAVAGRPSTDFSSPVVILPATKRALTKVRAPTTRSVHSPCPTLPIGSGGQASLSRRQRPVDALTHLLPLDRVRHDLCSEGRRRHRPRPCLFAASPVSAPRRLQLPEPPGSAYR